MAALFFYGTLRWTPLLRRVLGTAVDGLGVIPARLPDHAVVWAAGEAFPMIVAAPGGSAEGLVVQDLTQEQVDRLDYYEGGFAYDLQERVVETAQGLRRAQVYVPQPGRWTAGAPWDLDDWIARWGAITLSAAEEVMARCASMPVAEVQRLLPFFRARGWARALAADPAPQTLRSTMTIADVEERGLHAGYDGFFRLKAFDLRYRRFDGGWSDPVQRETFVAFDAALVLPYDPRSDHVLLIEQLRYGPIHRGDPAPWVLEPIAGLVDAGENPADCARREAEEEAGLALGDLMPMTRVYASPGYSTEFYHCYLGLCDLAGRRGGLGGLDSESEDIRSHVIPFPQAMALVDSGEVNAGPLVMMLLWLARAREDLRASA